ncbi:uncharacterized protein LOC127878008 isoform X2 [Dreissena polymorpha]|uniref:uncharacterized protein LOC127878008 isoform X2 n=1 Tax=Dreissena polymorpha TaxID=45954 RepID=UPI002263F59F|nr:uncharacterized protein LOC127878008 isoform X2 [Dreissena polymorpha]
MKLPSITTSSVVTGISGKSVYSDGYRHKDSWDKKSSLLVSLHYERWRYNQLPFPKDVPSDSYPDLSQRDMHELAAMVSKRQPNQHREKTTVVEETKNTNATNIHRLNPSHRYENITYKKQLLRRRRDKTSEADRLKAQEKAMLAEAEDQLKQRVQHELANAAKKQPNEAKIVASEKHDSGFDGSGRKEDERAPVSSNYSPSTTNLTRESDTVTCTPDDVTMLSPLTLSKSPNSKAATTNSTNYTELRDLAETI